MAEPRPLSGRDVGLVASAGAAESQRIDVDAGIGIDIGNKKDVNQHQCRGAGLEAGFDPGNVVAATSPTRLEVWVCGQDSNRSSANGDN